jgi:PLP dependent protein
MQALRPPSLPNALATGWHQVMQQIAIAALAAGRAAGEVTLLAVSKGQPVDAIRAVAACGQCAFGENYLQEALNKMSALADLNLSWHFIGHLQSNKTRDVATHFAWCHSIDRLKLAQRLNQQRPLDLPPLNCCIEVNISGEISKSGVTTAELDALVGAFTDFPQLRLRGFMCLPAPDPDPLQQHAAFHQLRVLLRRYPALDTLSMGTSGDYSAAIAEGATIVRVGTAVFGPRSR